jgi:hypothetical protein
MEKAGPSVALGRIRSFMLVQDDKMRRDLIGGIEIVPYPKAQKTS